MVVDISAPKLLITGGLLIVGGGGVASKWGVCRISLSAPSPSFLLKKVVRVKVRLRVTVRVKVKVQIKVK